MHVLLLKMGNQSSLLELLNKRSSAHNADEEICVHEIFKRDFIMFAYFVYQYKNRMTN